MRKLLSILLAVPIVALMFWGCEKESAKEVIVHDTVYVEFDEFTFTATGEDENGDFAIFADPTYHQDSARYEVYYYDWKYFNDIKVDEFIFWAFTTGKSLTLSINGELLGTSVPMLDLDNFEWQYLEIAYNTSKKSEKEIQELLKFHLAEMKKRGITIPRISQ